MEWPAWAPDVLGFRRRAENEWRVRESLALLILINMRTRRMAGELATLQTEVAETKAAVKLAIDGIADLKVKLADAIAAGNPAALTALSADLDTLQADIAAALAPPTPPVEPPAA